MPLAAKRAQGYSRSHMAQRFSRDDKPLFEHVPEQTVLKMKK
jgi:hypothetical protein